VRTRNVKFQEERTNLPDWEASNDVVETGRYKFYELHFSEAATVSRLRLFKFAAGLHVAR
jgi:hypothetical protein